MPCRKKNQKSRARVSRTRFFLLFWHTASVALHSGTRFSAMPHIIPASQVNELSGGENVRGDWHKLTHPHPLTATYSGNTRMLRKNP